MGQLTNQYVSSSYQGLLKMTDSTQGVTGTLQTVQTGDGTNTPLQISQTEINISGSLTVNGAPISFDTGSFATTGSNIFTGKQTITGSNGRLIYDGTTNATPNNALAEVHADNDSPWLERFYNDSYSTSGSVMSYFGWNDGRFIFHNDSTSSIAISVDGYYNDNLVVGDTNTTSNNDLIVSGAIKTNGAIQWSNNAFNYSDNVSGALYFSTLNNGTLHLNDDGGEGDVFIGWGPNNTHIRGNTDITGSLGVTNIKGTGSLLLQPNQSDARYLEVYNTSPTDTHITGSGGQIYIGDDKTYVKVDNYGSTKRIDIVADNGIYVSGSMSVTGSIDITGQYLVNGVPFSGGSNGTSGTSGQAGSSGTSGSSGQAGSSGTSGNGSSGTSGSSGLTDKTGLITTGSLGLIQGITGSISEFGGNIYIAQSGGNTQQFGYSGSGVIVGGNIIMGFPSGSEILGYTQSQLTASMEITGSNNILMGGPQPNDQAANGNKYYLNGFTNIFNGFLPSINTGSLLSPLLYQNYFGGVAPNFIFSTSSLGQPTINNNMLLGGMNIQHNSGSVTINNNMGPLGVTSLASTTTLSTLPLVQNNFVVGSTGPLNHNSSSILYTQNIGGMTVNNNYSSSVSAAVNNIAVSQNIIIGSQNTLTVTGSNTSNRRTFNSNLIAGRVNLINSNHSGSSLGHLIATSILGQNLIVSASNTSTTLGGSTFLGRFNATGSLQESSQDAVFVVGTGTGAAARRNAIHVDSNNNTRITGSLLISGSINITGDVKFASGSNKTMGTVALDGGNPGVATVSNSLVTANSLIFLTKQTLTNAHSIAVSSKGSSTFTITSTGNGDSDTVAYQIINPA